MHIHNEAIRGHERSGIGGTECLWEAETKVAHARMSGVSRGTRGPVLPVSGALAP